jgi:hypothetical protein
MSEGKPGTMEAFDHTAVPIRPRPKIASAARTTERVRQSPIAVVEVIE